MAEYQLGEKYSIETAGMHTEITAGVLDDEAKYVFMHGQCLAFATAVSLAIGFPLVVQTFADEDDFGDTDEDGVKEKMDNVGHCYVLRNDGMLLDVTGVVAHIDTHRANLEPGDKLHVAGDGLCVYKLDPEDPKNEVFNQALLDMFNWFDPLMADQDVELAETFIDPWWKELPDWDQE